jgi:hypothetical protein
MSKKTTTTFDRLMADKKFKKEFDLEYKEMCLSELLIAAMENDGKSVRKLATAAGISPTVVQKIRSGQQKDVKFGNFISLMHECGYDLILEKGKQRIALSV